MTRRRRAAAPLLALLVGVAGAGAGAAVPRAARAQAEPTSCQEVATQDELRIQVCTPPGAESSRATFPLKITVTNLASRPITQRPFNVTAIAAEVLSAEAGQQLPKPPNASWPGPPANEGTLAWTPEFTTNGRYDLRVTAAGDRQPSSQSADVTMPITLVVPPQQPSGVATEVAAGKVTVTWSNAEREPDLLSYEVSRAAQGSADYARVAFVDAATSKVVDAPPSGAWKYRVTAVRRGATPTEGIPSSPSRDATAEVAATSANGGATGSPGSGGAAGSGPGTGTTSAAGSGGTTSTTPSISDAPRTTIDLSVLNAARQTPPTTTRRPPEPDPGFQEVLPFNRTPTADAEEPRELGAGEPSGVPLGQAMISDGSDRRRSLGFVAFGLLLFVLGLTGLFLKSEVKRADELDPIDPVGEHDEPAVSPGAVEIAAGDMPAAAPVEAEPAAPRPARRVPSRRRVPLPTAAVTAAAVRELGSAVTGPAPDVVDVDVAAGSTEGPLREPEAVDPAPGAVWAAAAPVAAVGAAVDPAAAGADAAPLADATSGAPAGSTVAKGPVAEDNAGPPPAGTRSRLARARQARAARAAEVAALFGRDEDTADDAAHLAQLSPGATVTAVAVPAGTHRHLRRTVAPIDDPSLDVPDPPAKATESPRATAASAQGRAAPTARSRAGSTAAARPRARAKNGTAAVAARPAARRR